MFPVSFPGVKTSRDDVVVDIDKDRLIARMEKYFDPAVSHEQMRDIAPGAMEDSADFQARETRDYLRNRGFLSENVVRYCYRPFDVRWIYWEPETKLLDRNRADYIPHVFAENVWIVSQQKPRRDWSVPQVINSIGCLDLMDRGATCFPLWQKSVNQHSLKGFGVGVSEGEYTFNLSFAAFMQLGDVSISEPGTVTSSIGKNIANPRLPFYHTISILHSPAYLSENAGALRQDWPRIPIPLSKDALSSSALLGQRVAELLNSEKPMSGVTSGQIRDELKGIGTIMRVGGGQLNPDTDFAVRARWGYAGRGGITMPGQGRVVERDIAAGEFEGLGTRTVDVYLNDVAYWRNIPLRVWEYTIGGYQVIKKWLSYREFDLLKRPLTLDEVREVTNIARRIASLLLLEPQLDANYEAVKAQAVTLK